MKKLLLATAVATLSVSAAQAAPTVYGKAFLTADYKSGGNSDITTTTDTYVNNVKTTTVSKTSTDGEDKTSLNSTGSRIGIKGAEGLTANTDLVYQLEYGVEIDDGNGGTAKGKKQDQFYSRDTYLGVANKQYGTFVAGRLTTIDDNINYANQAAGGVLGGDDVLAGVSAPRANNAFAYFSPDYNGMQFMAMYGLDADQDLSNGGDLGVYAKHEQYGVGVKYEPAGQPYRVGATYIGAGDSFKDLRISGDYKINPTMTVGALYQNTDFNTKDNENTFTLSGAYKTATPWTVYAQGDIDNNVYGTDADRQRFILGGKYAFNPATTGHIYGAYLNGEATDTVSKSTTNAGVVTAVNTKTKTEQDGFGIGAGIEYKF